MHITFTYREETTPRDGVLLGVVSSSRFSGTLYFLVKEYGTDHPKSFIGSYMRLVRTIGTPPDEPTTLEALSTRVDRLAERLDEMGSTLDIVENTADIAVRRLAAIKGVL